MRRELNNQSSATILFLPCIDFYNDIVYISCETAAFTFACTIWPLLTSRCHRRLGFVFETWFSILTNTFMVVWHNSMLNKKTEYSCGCADASFIHRHWTYCVKCCGKPTNLDIALKRLTSTIFVNHKFLRNSISMTEMVF